MDPIRAAWADQQAELASLLDGLADGDWERPTPRCPGWEVRDVVLHLAQTNEMAIGSATHRFDEVLAGLTEGLPAADDVDAGAAVMVARDHDTPPAEIHERWRRGVDELAAVFDGADLHDRVTWVVGTLSVRTLLTTRLSETWIHTGDVGDAIGTEPAPTDRLEHVARLAWRTLPYAFAKDGRELSGPVMFDLVAPSGAAWRFVPDEPPETQVTGSGAQLCRVAARRLDPADSDLRATGADGAAVLELVRTYA
jgi:uncharacterized protein (TIGR03084 family)